MTARLSYLSCEISVGAVALCIRRLGDSIVAHVCMHAHVNVYIVRLHIYTYREFYEKTRETRHSPI